MSTEHQPELDANRLRAGASAIRELFTPDAVFLHYIAEGLDNDATRLDRGEPVTALAESLHLADGFAEEVPDA
jgi:hypothetical protein